ncbi:GntR family transcriptional regulator [Micromonospora pattaloongensis]|uniref:GntR family transcriptional regulator n=1 Tax=Micromonospora pattaloongensis TaxID=405436 RepID=A0A1H3MTV3_9ACTN|nr:winged helix-turn-helix domain-containing protein [Micromonospora pattaloongensis]SDY80111.1 GntR family transcriptional regulator [Micromonospora pattaloongensis]
MPRHLTYREIADDLAERISVGDYAPESKLPSYTELGRLYDVSYATIHRAVRILRERGIVYGESGRGVFVSEAESKGSTATS